VRVGVGVLVYRSKDSDEFLVGRRIGSHGSGTWQLPGGHLEFGETPENCAKREVLEETGLCVDSVTTITCTNDPMPAEGKHYVTVFTRAVCIDADPVPQLMEPEKCTEWRWTTMRQLASPSETEMRPLFLPLQHL
ncbi:NUDIX hydrolase domain-like protein, partial [Thamnocephalis sphaerospora]